ITCCSAEALVAAHEPSGPSEVGFRSIPGPRMTVSPPLVVIAPADPVGLPVLPPVPLAGFAPAPEAPGPVGAADRSGPPPVGEHAANPPTPIDNKRAPLQATRLDTMPQE